MAGEDALALSLATKGSPVEASAAGLWESERQGLAAERAPRRTLSGLYAELGSLLPDLASRAPQAEIVQEAIAYVRALRQKADELEGYRGMAAARTSTSLDDGGEVVASGETSCFAVRLRSARPGALTRVVEVFHRHGVAVLAATVVRNGGEAAVTITTAAVLPLVAGTIKADIIRLFASYLLVPSLIDAS